MLQWFLMVMLFTEENVFNTKLTEIVWLFSWLVWNMLQFLRCKRFTHYIRQPKTWDFLVWERHFCMKCPIINTCKISLTSIFLKWITQHWKDTFSVFPNSGLSVHSLWNSKNPGYCYWHHNLLKTHPPFLQYLLFENRTSLTDCFL